MSKLLKITEGQPGSHKPSPYRYMGMIRGLGLHMFDDGNGKIELFAKRKPGSGDAGWHLRRGSYVYEFCSSLAQS
jgi:hypothetical protein